MSGRMQRGLALLAAERAEKGAGAATKPSKVSPRPLRGLRRPVVAVPAAVLAPNDAGPTADIDRLVADHVHQERDRLIEEGVLGPKPPPDLLAWIARAIRSRPQ